MQEASNRQFQEMTQHYAQVNQNLLARSRQQDAQRAAGTAGAIGNDRNAQAATDNAAHQTALYSLDRQTFINPSTGQKIEASNQYNHQWMSSDGSTLIQNQDHTFDPNGVVYPGSQSWVELIPSN
jgi:queuine/archaeosine tRNA-ribosyltransferase